MGSLLSKKKENVSKRRSYSEPSRTPANEIVHARRSLSLNTESYVGNKVISILPGTHVSFRVENDEKKLGWWDWVMSFFSKEKKSKKDNKNFSEKNYKKT